MNNQSYRAAIFDLDGVITQTARLHAHAWKQMFDRYLQQRSQQGKDYKPFDINADYRQYIDGKPRYDGVRNFLASRHIDLPEGDPDDEPGTETVCGLGNRKNELFLDLLQQEGVDTYADTLAQIHQWREQGMKTAVISSSRNCAAILEKAGLTSLFDTKVDGVDSNRLHLTGKPAPDIFLAAARQLAVEPLQAIVIEDAIAGVEAGRTGQFGLVVGVGREGDGGSLREHGADIVVQDLRELSDISSAQSQRSKSPGSESLPSALEHFNAIAQALSNHSLALFLDYDGTLTPIVNRPEDAILSEQMRSRLQQLADCTTVAVVSGRDLADVRERVGLSNLHYAGSHGFDMLSADGTHTQQPEAQSSLPDLDAAERQLRDRLEPIAGVQVERKEFAIAIHYREAAESEVEPIADRVDAALSDHPQLRKRDGKKIFELQPDIPWDKGRAVFELLNQLQLDRSEVMPMYIGDDTTDEDAFRALRDRGIGIRVGRPDQPTDADYYLQNSEQVQQFFQALLQQLQA